VLLNFPECRIMLKGCTAYFSIRLNVAIDPYIRRLFSCGLQKSFYILSSLRYSPYRNMVDYKALLILLTIGYAVASDWAGLNHPGAHDPSDPFQNDWHCDKKGFWHNNEHDPFGHLDPRCHKW
jgi:hypothetical protein